MKGSDVRAALTEMLSGGMSKKDIIDALIQIEEEGVGAEQLSAGVEVMRKYMLPVKVPDDAIDIVGTGGTGMKTLSISTATALVVAGAGVTVAKHGNRGASSPTGTADTLSELGVNITMSPERATAAVFEVGIGFLFAPTYHPAMRHVGLARKEIGKRTIFNRLGPLSNPGSVKNILLGSAEKNLVEAMALALKENGVTRAMVVHGEDGLDEITTTSSTMRVDLDRGKIKTSKLHPSHFRISTAQNSELKGGLPRHNAKALSDLLNGKHFAYRDIVLVNAAAALLIAGKVQNILDGKEMAIRSIDEGKAKEILKKLVDFSNG